MKFVDPRNDVAFKKIFGNEEHTEILISFLNAVLDLTGDKEILEVELLNPYQAPRLEALKYTLLDVRARDRRGVTFIVEMQITHVEGLRKRFTYYASKAYASQIERGQDYPKLNQVIFIGILDFNEFDTQHYLTRVQLLNTETYQQELKDVEFNFIELPKFTKKEQELKTILEKWIFFLKHADELDVMPESADTVALRRAYDIANQFSWTKEELEVYEYWGIKEQDERGAVQYALKTGRHQERLETARRMLADKLDPEIILKYTGLTVEELAALEQSD
jgi:predicted transposase/invertase (TIGR01784 family)